MVAVIRPRRPHWVRISNHLQNCSKQNKKKKSLNIDRINTKIRDGSCNTSSSSTLGKDFKSFAKLQQTKQKKEKS